MAKAAVRLATSRSGGPGSCLPIRRASRADASRRRAGARDRQDPRCQPPDDVPTASREGLICPSLALRLYNGLQLAGRWGVTSRADVI